ncbi:MAG: type IV secretion system DNA-binding domain-containing protein [Candidatus Omnitrophica bacterium]|nr:type IV secretion system DNA-binding domain-containing protein [Candidatus Omnitrophota bacterium]
MEILITIALLLGLVYFRFEREIHIALNNQHFWFFAIVSCILGYTIYFIAGHFWEKLKNKVLILRQGLGKFDKKKELNIPFISFNLEKKLIQSKDLFKDKTFLGLDAETKNKDTVCVDDNQRCHHMQILGMTGTGKTESIFLPLVYQDAIKNRPIIIIDAKGEMSFIQKLNALLKRIGREDDFMLFSLAYKELSCSYNPLYVGECDPQIIVDAFFNNFTDENSFYRNTAKTIFTNAFGVLHSLGKPFTVMDVYTYLTNNQARMSINGKVKGGEGVLHLKILNEIISTHAKRDESWKQVLAGFYNYLLDHKDPILNVDDPDIVLTDIIKNRKIVYFQLPTNAYPVQAKSIARMIQANLRYISSLIQIGKIEKDILVSVIIDEYASFAEESFVEVLNKARSSGMMVTLSHQSLSDLKNISEPFMKRIDENTLNKIYLKQTDPELCELVAKSFGTYEHIESTLRKAPGKFGNAVSTGETSNRRVKEFYFHPDRVKHLNSPGQGWFIYRGNNSKSCVNFGYFQNVKGGEYKKKEKTNRKKGLRIFEEYYMKKNSQEKVINNPEEIETV